MCAHCKCGVDYHVGDESLQTSENNSVDSASISDKVTTVETMVGHRNNHATNNNNNIGNVHCDSALPKLHGAPRGLFNSDGDSGCFLEECAWVPPGLTPKQVITIVTIK